MRRILLMMALIVICAVGGSAQSTKVITGAVTDKNGNPLPNALVEATGGAESVTTDADGTFRIEVPFWLKTLTAKYAGYRDKKVALNQDSQIVFEMRPQKRGWFINAAFALSDNTYDWYGGAGLMGGYLGNWGGYARFMLPFGDGIDVDPTATAGVIKQVSKPVYLYLGSGCSLAGMYEIGCMFEVGAIYKINDVNFSIGYGGCTDFGGYVSHSILLSVGYCFW